MCVFLLINCLLLSDYTKSPSDCGFIPVRIPLDLPAPVSRFVDSWWSVAGHEPCIVGHGHHVTDSPVLPPAQTCDSIGQHSSITSGELAEDEDIL